MNLLCIFPWLALGGADGFNLDLLGCLRERGWRVVVATTLPSDHPWRHRFAPLCEEIVDLTAFPPGAWPVRLLALAQGRDAVLVSHSLFGYLLLPYLRGHLSEAAFVDYCHIAEPTWLDGGFPRVSLNYGQYLDMQIVSSYHLRGWMVAEGGAGGRIAVCTTNIDTALWNPERYDRVALRAALGIAPNVPVALFAGRLTAQKRPRLAAEVMRLVVASRPDALFLVAGDGEERPWLERFVRRHGLERHVRLLGALASERVRELLALSDLFFLPSANEGISLAIYEALAMGAVPVAADVGGQRELVIPECGLLLPRSPHEADDYAVALLRLIDDPALLRRMAVAGRQRVAAQFPLSAMGDRMHALLLAAHERRRREPRTPTAAVARSAAHRAVAHAADDLATIDRRWRARLRPRRVLRALVRRAQRRL